MSQFELTDLVRYFHNVRNDKGELVPIIGEDKLAVTAALSYLLEDTNFLINAYSNIPRSRFALFSGFIGLIGHTLDKCKKSSVGGISIFNELMNS